MTCNFSEGIEICSFKTRKSPVETQVNSALEHINVTLVTACESQIESLLQVSLQLYIYFGGAKVEKRQFSELQLIAISTSILMIVGNQVKNTFVRRSSGESLLEDFKRMIKSSLVSVGIIATFIFSVLMSSKAFFSFNVWFMSFGQSVECPNWCRMSNICYCFLFSLQTSFTTWGTFKVL